MGAVGSANSTESPTESPAVSPTVSSTENLTDSPTDDPCPTMKNKHYCQDDSLCEWTEKKGKKDKACYRRNTKSPTESPTVSPSGSPTESSTAPTVVSTPGGTRVAGAKSSKLFKDKSERPSKKPTDIPTF